MKVKTRSGFFLTAISCAVLSLLFACTNYAEKKKIDGLIKTYNKALEGAFANRDFEPLKKITTEKEYNKVSVYIMSYAGQGETLSARLVQLEIKGIDVEGSSATADTSEQWEYERKNTETGEVMRPKTLYIYEMKYFLVKDKDTWKVDHLKIEKETVNGKLDKLSRNVENN
ncbi:MAG TPA: hypothetical protein VF790_11435 [Dissulfurispiraceae bacterium]